MKTIFKGNKFSIVWEIFHNTTRLPFDFTGMNIEVSLTSNSYSSVLSNFNVKENVISTEIEANSLPSGVYDILCRFSTLNEQAYCFYKNAFHISNNPCFCDKSGKIEISTYATYVTPDALLTQFNSIYLTYLGNPKNTRNNIPEGMRRKGLIITYTNESNETITERATSASQKDNDHWGLDTNWSRIDELSLSGDLSVSANGTWIINGEDTQIKAVGPKGDAGITPWLKTINNRLYYSYDGKNWEACSEEIAAFFRFKSTREESNGATIGNIQISRDNKNWQDLSPEFVNHLRVSAYVRTKGELPTNKPVGTMYGVGPTYKEEDTARANPIYRIYVYDGTTWVDNGTFTSIAAGIVQEPGYSENAVMSQKAVTEKLSEFDSGTKQRFYNVDTNTHLYEFKYEDLNSYQKVNGFIPSGIDVSWLIGAGEVIFIPIKEYRKIRVSAEANRGSWFAFVKDNTTEGKVKFSEGTHRIDTPNTPTEYEVPSDANYVAVFAVSYTTGGILYYVSFETLIGKPVSEELEKNIKKVINVEEDLSNVALNGCVNDLKIGFSQVYAMLNPDGSYRENLPGYISKKMEIGNNTWLYLESFYERYIPTEVCPIVFFKEDDVIAHIKFTDSEVDNFSVKVPKEATHFKVSTEMIEGFEPKVYGNDVSSQRELSYSVLSKRVLLKGDTEYSTNKTLLKVASSNFIYKNDCKYVQYDETIEVSNVGDVKTIQQAIDIAEKSYKGKIVNIAISGDYVLSCEEDLNGRGNTYVITCSGVITSFSGISKVSEDEGVVKFEKPVGVRLVNYLKINGNIVALAKKYGENAIEDMPSLVNTSSSKKLILQSGDSENGYIYKLLMDNTSLIEVGAVLKFYTEWICTTAKVTDVSNDYVMIHTDNKIKDVFINDSNTYGYVNSKYDILNTSKVAAEGTFWCDDDYIYYKKKIGESVNVAETPCSGRFFVINGCDNIVFDGCVFDGTYSIEPFRTYRQSEVNRPAAFEVENSRGIHFFECEFTNMSDHCVWFKDNTHNCSVQKCYIHDIGCGGVVIGIDKTDVDNYVDVNIDNILIYSNIIRGYGRINAAGCGVCVTFASNVTVLSNHIFDGYYSGVSCGWGWGYTHGNKNTTIVGNVIHHILQFVMNDGAGIYTLGGFDGGTIEGNTIYCVNTRDRWDSAIGIYHDQASNGILNFNNIIYACDQGIYAQVYNNSAMDIIFDSNIIVCTDNVSMGANGGNRCLVRYCIFSPERGVGYSTAINHPNETSFVQRCVAYNIKTGDFLKESETPSIYGWDKILPEFEDWRNGDFRIKNLDVFTKNGYSFVEGITYKGDIYPKFESPKFEHYKDVSEEFIENYKVRYSKNGMIPISEYAPVYPKNPFLT